MGDLVGLRRMTRLLITLVPILVIAPNQATAVGGNPRPATWTCTSVRVRGCVLAERLELQHLLALDVESSGISTQS
ncbi:hypothetical protein [Nonomuraea rubra]|uniref:hypothetical protein n=1 Tax=Nonomuraea rubra TaxID=46180 RepID=UPI0033EFB23E